MKKLFGIIGFLLLLAVGGVILLPKFVSIDQIEQQVKQKVKEATGRNINFADASFVFWPNIGVTVSDVSVDNPSWAKNKNMLEAKAVDVSLAVMPLLEKRVEVKKFLLREPKLSLETGPDGSSNLSFAASSAPEAAEKKETAGGEMPSGFQLKFGETQIVNGALSIVNHQTGSVEELENVNITLVYPDLSAPLRLQGAVTYKKKDVNFTVNVEKLMELAAKKSSPVSLNVKTPDLSADMKGIFQVSDNHFNGDISADISSLAGLASWTSGGDAPNVPFKKISFKSKADASPAQLKLTGAELALDDIKASGDVIVGLKGKPDIHARLSMSKLDLDRFVNGGAAEGAAGDASGKAGSTEWSSAPIDFSGLKKVNADLVLKTDGFSVKGVDVGASTLTAKVDDGNLQASSSEASLFDGKFSSSVNVNAQASVPTLAFKFNMAGVQAKPVLSTFAGFKKLSGAADAMISVTSSGQSQKAIVSNLMGDGNVMFRDGSLEGIDLVNIAKMIQNRLTDMGVGEGKTDFVALGGTFTINKGVATNSDLSMKGPLVQATGKGQIDLPQKRIDYRVVPVLTASSAVEGASGIRVPVDIKGPFSNIKIKPDYAGMIQDAINNPDAIKDTLKGAKQQIKDVKGTLKDIKTDPSKALNSLLGGGGLFAPAAKPAVPEAAPAPAPAAPAVAPEAAPVPAEAIAPETAPVETVPAESAPVETPAEPAPAQ